MLSAGSALRLKDLVSIFRAIPIGKVHATGIPWGIGFTEFFREPDAAAEPLFFALLCLFFILTRGTGFTGSAKESLLFRSAPSHRAAFVQNTDPSDFVHLIGVDVLRLAGGTMLRFG
jgi:hypothetical protein